jgi:hypothetical protein
MFLVADDQNEKTNKDTAQDEKAKSNDQSQKSSQKSESKGLDSQSSEQVKDDDNSSKDDTAETQFCIKQLIKNIKKLQTLREVEQMDCQFEKGEL